MTPSPGLFQGKNYQCFQQKRAKAQGETKKRTSDIWTALLRKTHVMGQKSEQRVTMWMHLERRKAVAFQSVLENRSESCVSQPLSFHHSGWQKGGGSI